MLETEYSDNPLVQRRKAGEITFVDYIQPVADSAYNILQIGKKLAILQLPEEAEKRAKELEKILPFTFNSKFRNLDISKPRIYKRELRFPTFLIATAGLSLASFFMYDASREANRDIALTGLGLGVFVAFASLLVSYYQHSSIKEDFEKEITHLPRTIQDTLNKRAKYLDKFF